MPGPSASVTPPAAPSGLTGTARSATTIDLTWNDESTTETAFHVERATSGGAFVEIAVMGAGIVRFSDTSVAASITYQYRVRARNSGGFSAYSNIATVTTQAPPATIPAAPANLAARAVSGGQVALTWTDESSNEDAFHVERAPAGGAFSQIASLAAAVTSYTDTAVAPETAYQYRVSASNAQGASVYSNTAPVTTLGSATNQPIKNITFEAGSLTDPVSGTDRSTGTVSLETTAPLKGGFSARFPNVASSYLEEAFTATDDVFVSFYVRLTALPTATPRIVLLSNAGVSVANLVLQTSGRLRLRVDATVVGTDSPPLVPGQLYRVGIRQRKGTGGNAVVEAFVAAGDDQFGAPFARTSTGTWTTAADRIRVGNTNPSAGDLIVDDIRLDSAAMPGPTP